MKNKITSYSVPYSKNITTGPLVRVNGINKEIAQIKSSNIIFADGFNKFKQSLSAKVTDLLYIESSTNRISLFDLISLLILKRKSKRVVVYIRDVYVELFPEEYKTFRKRVTVFFNQLTIKFYAYIATDFAFPTNEMGIVFFSKNKLKVINSFELPPACDIECQKATQDVANERLKAIKIMYLGGINYKYSGINNFINLVEYSPKEYLFYIVTYDKEIFNYLDSLSTSSRKKVTIHTLDKVGVDKFIKENNITYMFHSRPINEYDNLTYPIKFFDALTWNLPLLTAKNEPVVKVLGANYPLYVDVTNPAEIVKTITQNKPHYFTTLQQIESIALSNRYDNRVGTLIEP
ncbi:hypothetical protein CMT41_10615 [Colwellia sp. MT41]|uniref:hypothetical protein n=1 Tax=Colwellia sp. MT41 TaxID=58049 RepID=UPI000717ABB1|nr:hypothetical protein [Colwellia sp. MT41]ALO35120.1 hypothetical protein CMT41_10615 [Colwellia sp. MT41]